LPSTSASAWFSSTTTTMCANRGTAAIAAGADVEPLAALLGGRAVVAEGTVRLADDEAAVGAGVSVA
jgi:hypothetical protein